MQVRQQDEEAWCTVERVDFSHGFVHVDQYSADGLKTKNTALIPPEYEEDLDGALKWATLYIWDIEQRTGGWL